MAQTKSKKPTPRAIRNNNPLNIRRTKDKWFGQLPKQTDPFFVEFSTPTYGFRAAFRLMHTYYFKYQLHTLQAIVRRWAPPSENNTTNYIDFVAREVNVSPDLTLIAPHKNPDFWIRLVLAMAKMEIGYLPQNYNTYARRAFHLAFNPVKVECEKIL